MGKANDNTNLCNEFLLQIWKQWEDSAMLLASKKQQYKEKTKNTKAQQDRQNTQEMTAGKNKEKWAYKKLPIKKTIQNHSVYSKCWKSKKEFFLLSNPLERKNTLQLQNLENL